MIIGVREPLATLKSILNLNTLVGHEWTQETACKYYCDRLKYLSELRNRAEKFGCPTLFIETDRIINETFTLLAELTGFLQLSSDLQSEYEIFDQTGVAGYGDPSDNIKKQFINRERHKSKISLKPEVISDSENAYQSLRDTL